MPTIRNLLDENKEVYYPITTPQAVRDSEGKNLDTKLSDIDSKIVSLQTDTKPKLEVDEVKDNGNIVLKDGQGNTKEYMAATPSGDPMHYAYVDLGAEYNATDADIIKTAPWGDEVTHKAGCWYLNGLGDLTSDEMRKIYAYTSFNVVGNADYQGYPIRTNFYPRANYVKTTTFVITSNSAIEVLYLGDKTLSASPYICCRWCTKLKYIVGVISETSSYHLNNGANFQSCYDLEYITIKNLGSSIHFDYSSKIRTSCIAYMINNASTSATGIVITLHATAYANAMADEDVQTALANNTNVTLASA